MRIDNQDIVRAVRQLRDEENSQLNVQPWNRRRSAGKSANGRGTTGKGAFHGLPGWLVTIPAAAVIGFVLGYWTKSSSQLATPLTALVDTVYIKVHDPQVRQDTFAVASLPYSDDASTVRSSSRVKVGNGRRTGASSSRHLAKQTDVSPYQQLTLGRPVSDDSIRYDLLVMN